MKTRFLLSLFILPLLLCCNKGNKDVAGSYTLTCNANGGTFSSNNSSTLSYKNKSVINSVEQPVYSGHNFEGWYTSKSLTSSTSVTFPYTLANDKTIYAHWSDSSATYTVTLNATSGKFSDGSTTKTISKVSQLYKSNLSNPIPNNSDYEFKGWSKTYDGSSLVSFPLTIKSNTTLYAVYVKKTSTYQLTLNANGGKFTSNSSETKTLTNQSSITISNLEKPTFSGYNFLGWFNGTGSSATQYSGTIVLSSNITLYAHWEKRVVVQFSLTDSNGSTITPDESGTYNITEAGTYNLSGDLTTGYINISGNDSSEVTLNLNNVTLTNETTNSATNIIEVSGIDKLIINVLEGTTNYINDSRTFAAGASGAALLCDADLKITGLGTLNVSSTYNNAIHCKKDLKISNATIYAKAINTSIRGNDSITVDSGYISATSVNGSGFKTSSTKTKKSGGQRGIIAINGGTIVCNSYFDAFDAAYDVQVNNEPNITINTGKYADVTGEEAILKDMYICTTSSLIKSNNYHLYACCNSTSSASSGTFYEASFYKEEQKEIRPGSYTTYYYYKIDGILANSNNKYIGLYVSNSSEPSTSSYISCSTMNIRSSVSTYNLAVISNLRSGYKTFSYSWDSFDNISKKAMKADNAITINGGNININSEDDCLHANYSATFDSGLTSVGEININGGSLNLYSNDDGIHSENVVNINDGTINITNSVEGIEAPYININSGETKVYATDDGLNACGEARNGQLIKVTGGTLEIEVVGDDVDGIDSNDSYTQTGGIVITKAISQGGPSSGLDCSEGTCSLTGGILMALGNKPESSPSSVSTQTLTNGLSAKTWEVINTSSQYCPFVYTNSATINGRVYIYSKESGTFSINSVS